MLFRAFQDVFRRKLQHFPIVTLLGPRQCGKTTFIRKTLPDWKYLDLERPSDRNTLAADPEARLKQLREHIIFDEAQQLPALFPLLRSLVDEARGHSDRTHDGQGGNGRFVMLGSASPTLIRNISESLAGRTTFLEVTPFHWNEVVANHRPESFRDLWLRGGFPDPFQQPDNSVRQDWFDAYTRTFIERDLPTLGIEISSIQMRRLWAMLAHANGGLWNASQLASSLGISYHTVNRYLEILEQTFLIRRLPPYFANIGKRLVKSPKILFRDTGLLHWFLGIRSHEQLDVHPARGLSWEAMVIEHVATWFERHHPGAQAFFWRTHAGAEVDLLIDICGRLIPFEIKLHSSPTGDLLRGLRACMHDLNLKQGFVLYPGTETYPLGEGILAVPVEEVLADPLRALGLVF